MRHTGPTHGARATNAAVPAPIEEAVVAEESVGGFSEDEDEAANDTVTGPSLVVLDDGRTVLIDTHEGKQLLLPGNHEWSLYIGSGPQQHVLLCKNDAYPNRYVYKALESSQATAIGETIPAVVAKPAERTKVQVKVAPKTAKATSAAAVPKGPPLTSKLPAVPKAAKASLPAAPAKVKPVLPKPTVVPKVAPVEKAADAVEGEVTETPDPEEANQHAPEVPEIENTPEETPEVEIPEVPEVDAEVFLAEEPEIENNEPAAEEVLPDV